MPGVAERRALLSARAIEPPPELADEVWSDLAVAVSAMGAVGGTGATAGSASALGHASAGGKLAILKALVIGAAAGTVTTSGVVVATHAYEAPARVEQRASVPPGASRTATSHRTRVPVAAPAAAAPGRTASAPDRTRREQIPVARDTSSAPSTSMANSAASSETAKPAETAPVAAFTSGDGARSAPASVTEDARAEARLVGVARDALRRHDARSALSALDAAEVRSPSGILVQEREALSISALSSLGKTAEAAARARAFLRAYPNSPHAARVRRALGYL